MLGVYSHIEGSSTISYIYTHSNSQGGAALAEIQGFNGTHMGGKEQT